VVNPGRRTHHWDDWDLETLLRHKQESGIATSLVVPARNEAATVGAVVSRVREALVEPVALLDEIVVIDSDSTDDTHGIATAAGATVHRSADVRPDLGTFPGKGEAMWKALFVTRGDLIVFMDGGRVTELVGRPLIALDWPELGWLVQPMAGEWAVRRDLLERLWVPTGYAVELAALVDTLRLLGPDAIAQVDLGRRAHRHQALRDLGAMAVQILAASDRRARGVYPGEGVRQVGLHQHRVEGRTVVTEVRGIELTERPPSVEVRPVVGGSAP